MAIYRCKKDLIGITLKYCDILYFGNIKYEVQPRYLFYYFSGEDDNSHIFNKLHLNPEEFCEKAYGYKCGRGVFPECKRDDYEALTRCAIALYEEYEKQHVSEKIDLLSVEECGKTTTSKKEEKHENRFKKRSPQVRRGTHPGGSAISGKRSKTSASVGHLSHRKVFGC